MIFIPYEKWPPSSFIVLNVSKSDGFLTAIIIHSKYLSVSDWLKSHG